MIQVSLTIDTPGRGTIDICSRINQALSQQPATHGLCHLFLQHTSASLILCESFDPDVQRDLERFTQRWVPDGDPLFSHTAEGPDDMPAHIRSVFTHNDMTIPFANQRLQLGTWQSLFLWEHRHLPHQRTIIMSLIT